MKTTRLPIKQSTLSIEVSLDATEIPAYRKLAVEKLAPKVTVKGFRQGKAPHHLVERHLDPEAVSHETIHAILNDIVPKIVTEQKLTLIGNPVLEKLDNPEGKDWLLTVSFPLKPTVNLEGYQELVKKVTVNPEKKENKTDKILNALLENSQFEVPPSLIEREIEASLSRLIKQTESLGISVEKYLESIKKTPVELRKEYETTAINSLKIELILLQLAENNKFTVLESEIDDLINSFGDPKIQAEYSTASNRQYLESIIIKRKVIDHLNSLL